MLRILLWRLLFDWKHLQKFLFPCRAAEKYFAFGGNLDPTVLRTRRIEILKEEPYVLKDHAISFNVQGRFQGMGYASVEEQPGSVVYGKIYEISKIDAQRLDYYEASPFLRVYKRASQPLAGKEMFFYQAVNPQPGLKPTQKYLNYIVDAYKSCDHVPNEVIDELSSFPVLTSWDTPKEPHFLIQDYHRFGRVLSGLLKSYDALCLDILEGYLYSFSLTAWLLRTPCN